VQHESGFYCPIGGTVTDGPWGSGFNPYWSQVQVYYKDVTTQLCLDDSSINNTGLYAYTCPREGTVGGHLAVLALYIGTTAWSAGWYDGMDPVGRCPAGHHCVASVSVWDIWSVTTQIVELQ
jgi:hypothetical protein